MTSVYPPNNHQDLLDTTLLGLIDETDPGRFNHTTAHKINPSCDVQAAHALYIMAKNYPPDFAKPAAFMLLGIISTKFPSYSYAYNYEPGRGLAKKPEPNYDMQLTFTSREIRQAISTNDIDRLVQSIEYASDWGTCDLIVNTIAMQQFTSPRLVEPLLDTLLIPRIRKGCHTYNKRI